MIIQQKKFMEALEKGALAALSEEAQSDTSIIANLIKSVRIEVDSKNLTIESATKLLATKCVIPLDGDIEVKEEGEAFVSAKEICTWVSRQPNAKLAVSLSKLDTPDIVNPLVNEADGTVVKGIKRIGFLKIASKDGGKTGTKWELDSYDASQLGEYEMKLPSVKKFEVPVKQLNEGLKSVAFAIMPKHYQHLYDSISFQNYNSKVYMLASDTARASIYEIDQATDNNLDVNLLAPTKFLLAATKLANGDENISFYFDEKSNKIYLSQGEGFIVKMSTADADKVKIFPPVKLLLSKSYKTLAKLPKEVFVNRLMNSIMVNDSAALFVFKGDQLVIHAVSSSGKKPLSGNASVTDLLCDFSAVWGVSHILDFLKLQKDEDVVIGIPENDKGSVQFTSKQDPNWIYYVMAQDAKKTKYDQVKVD